MLPKAKNYYRLFRPETLVAPILGAVFFGWMGLGSVEFRWEIIVSALILAMANASSNIINQVFDAEIDKVNRPKRPIPMQLVSKNEALSVGVLLYGTTLILAFSLLNTTYALFIALILLFTWVYSAPPRLRDKFIVNNFAVGTPRGALGILAAYSLFGDPFTPHVLYMALVLGIFVFFGNISKDFRDVRGDKQFGVRNFVTVCNSDGAHSLMVSGMGLAYFLVALGVGMGWLVQEAMFVLFGVVVLIVTNAPLSRDRYSQWKWFYFQLAVWIFGFSMAYLI